MCYTPVRTHWFWLPLGFFSGFAEHNHECPKCFSHIQTGVRMHTSSHVPTHILTEGSHSICGLICATYSSVFPSTVDVDFKALRFFVAMWMAARVTRRGYLAYVTWPLVRGRGTKWHVDTNINALLKNTPEFPDIGSCPPLLLKCKSNFKGSSQEEEESTLSHFRTVSQCDHDCWLVLGFIAFLKVSH